MDRTVNFTILLLVILIHCHYISTALAESGRGGVPEIKITINRTAVDIQNIFLKPHIEIQGSSQPRYQINSLVSQTEPDCFQNSYYFTANVTGRSNSYRCWSQQLGIIGTLNVTVGENIHLQLERDRLGSVIETKQLYCINPNHTLMINDKPAEKQLYKWRIYHIKDLLLVEVKILNSGNWTEIRNSAEGSDTITTTCRKIDQRDKCETGIIAGVVSACVVLVIVLVVLFITCKERRSVKKPRTVRATLNGIDYSGSVYEARPVNDEDYNLLHQNVRRPVNAEIYEQNYNVVPPITTKLNSEQRSDTYCMVELPVCKNTTPYSDPAQENTTLLSRGDHHYSHGNDVYTQVNKGENQQFNPRASQEIPERVTMVANAIYEDGQPDAKNDDVVYSLADDL